MASSNRGVSSLTPEERAALSLAAAGLTTADVAERMYVPPALVREWLAAAVEKLGASSKLEAVLIADRTGQIDPPP